MKSAVLTGLLLTICSASAIGAQTATGDWIVGKSGDGYDAIGAPAKESNRAALFVLCLPSGPGVRVQFGKLVGGSSNTDAQVKLRFDTKGETPTRWALNSGNGFASLATSRVLPFIAHAKDAAELGARVTDPLSREFFDLTFSLNGFDEALAVLPCTKGL